MTVATCWTVGLLTPITSKLQHFSRHSIFWSFNIAYEQMTLLTHCIHKISRRVYFTNCEDPDEMLHNARYCLHNAAFHQDLHCLLRLKKIFRQKKHYSFKNYNLADTPRYIQWTISTYIYQTSRKNPQVYKGLYTHPDVSSGARGLVFLYIHTLCIQDVRVLVRLSILIQIRKFYLPKILITFLPINLRQWLEVWIRTPSLGG